MARRALSEEGVAMAEPLRLMCVFAHPDDETLGTGSTLARYAAEGVGIYLVTATRGERGWFGAPGENPGLAVLGAIRTQELHAAAEVLGLREVAFLNYIDGDLDQAAPAEAIAQIVAHVRRVRPQVVVTFGPDGAYGHPDHIAISQFTSAALVCAADAQFADPHDLAPHRVAKLYFMADTISYVEALRPFLGDITMEIDGVQRHMVGWEEWAVTTRIDGTAHWRTALRAALCHQSQLASLPDLTALSDAQHERLWGVISYYRAFSTVNGGRRVEDDLFEGLR
jgi:LmbE family N-acetylglucosaminyl deacetylase